MKYLSEKEFNAQMKRIRAANLTKKRKAELKEEISKIAGSLYQLSFGATGSCCHYIGFI